MASHDWTMAWKERKGNEVNMFNTIQNIGRTTQVKV